MVELVQWLTSEQAQAPRHRAVPNRPRLPHSMAWQPGVLMHFCLHTSRDTTPHESANSGLVTSRPSCGDLA